MNRKMLLKKPMKLFINMNKLPKPKNQNGELGTRCDNCGGFGYTVNVKGKKLDCKSCNKTGVKIVTVKDLQKQIEELRIDLNNLRGAILKSLGIKVKEPSEIKNKNE